MSVPGGNLELAATVPYGGEEDGAATEPGGSAWDLFGEEAHRLAAAR